MPEQINQPTPEENMDANQKRKRILGNAVLAAEIFPIIYSCLLLIIIVCSGFMTQDYAYTIETLAFATIPFTLLCLILSIVHKLCIWYRVHAFVMLLPLAIPISRHFFPDFNMWWVILIAGVPLLATTLMCMYRFNAWSKCKDIFHMFIRPTKPKPTITNKNKNQ